MDTSLLVLLEGVGACLTAIVLGGGFLVILGYLFVVGQRRRQEAWHDLASRLGLNYEAEDPFMGRVHGSYRGRHLLLERVRRGDEQRLGTHVRVPVRNEADVFLHLAPAGASSPQERDDVTIGKPELDEKYTVHAWPDSFAAQLLAPAGLRRQLLSLGDLELKVQRHHVDLLLFRDVTDVSQLEKAFNLLCDLAEGTEELVPQWLPSRVGMWNVGV